jgi:hypothetical protein
VAAIDLVTQLLNEIGAGHSVGWQEARDQIHTEYGQATTTKERVILLELHRTLMDAVERNCVEADKLADFRKARLQDYRLLLISEAIAGRTDGNVDPVRMGQIVQRETEAGRLSTDDELYVLGVGGSVFISGVDPTGKLIPQPTAFDKRAAMVCRTLVLLAGLWIVLRKGWPDQLLARRLVDLTLGELVGAIIGIVLVVASAGWLLRLLFRTPPDSRRTQDWCDGWTWALIMPVLLVGAATMAVYLDPSGPLTKYAAVFLAEIVSLFV